MEWLPKALNIGISETLFWTLNPHRLKPYMTAYEQRTKERLEQQNMMAYVQGMYIAEAIKATVGNMFSKGQVLEYPKEPYELFKEEKVLTEEEKMAQVNLLFAELETMQRNFENGKGTV